MKKVVAKEGRIWGSGRMCGWTGAKYDGEGRRGGLPRARWRARTLLVAVRGDGSVPRPLTLLRPARSHVVDALGMADEKNRHNLFFVLAWGAAFWSVGILVVVMVVFV